MIDTEVADLLMRMYIIWPSAMPPENRRKAVREEWQRLLSKGSAKLLNEALDRYATSPAGRYMPKPSELLQICDNILEERQRRNALTPGRCVLCGGSKYTLVQYDGENLFYGHYDSLAMRCPCARSGEMAALRQGLKISRKVRGGMLEFWLENDRLTGRLSLFKKVERSETGPGQPVNVRSNKLQNAFSSIQADLPF